MVTDTAFTFQMCIPSGKTFSLVPWSRSSVDVKVTYQGHILKKNGCFGALVFYKQSLSNLDIAPPRWRSGEHVGLMTWWLRV